MFHPTLSKSGRLFFGPVIKLCEWLGNHHPEFLLKLHYRVVFKKSLNLRNPQDLNEKIIWAKLYSDTSSWVELADKYRVRRYVEDLGFGDTLVKLYAVWHSAEEVDFDMLPDNFIIKANNGDGKGTNRIIRKPITDVQKAEYLHLIKHWLKRKNIGALHAEPHYRHMSPCVIAEEVLPLEDGETSLTDYKLWIINGKCEYIWVCKDRIASGNSASVLLYDSHWNSHPEFSVFNTDYLQGTPIPKPANLDKMINIAERLAGKFPVIRVDLYNIRGKIYFGELTFTSQGGFMDFFNNDFLEMVGKQINIEDFPKK